MNDLSIDLDLIRRYSGNGPRYTSYPTAAHFVEAFDANMARAWLAKRNIGGVRQALSLYFHLPFCANICFYCACNKIITKDRSKSATYLRYLEKEVSMVSGLIDEHRVQQLHWGGGTPTFLSHDEMRQLMDLTKRHFELQPGGEYSIELDPRTVNAETLALLTDIGFNRASIGVQDFDPDVQAAVNRRQGEAETLQVIRDARAVGFKSISIDLIYGLPRQNVVGFDQTLDKVIAAAPDRISIYSYAHMPALFKHQRRIVDAELPGPDTRLALLILAIRKLTAAGYVSIGMDHFALPHDELAVAQREGRLHRNFQGYSTHPDCDLLGFGISAIGKVGPTYGQNVRTLDEYYARLDQDELPVSRGVVLTADDLLRRSVIQALMCNFEVSIEAIETAYLIDFWEYFSEEVPALEALEEDGLVELGQSWITVTPKGRLLVRAICAAFDKYLRTEQRQASYSKVI